MDKPFRERRKYVRVKAEAPVRYKILKREEMEYLKDLTSPIREGGNKNISCGGILLETEEDLPVGTLLALEVILPEVLYPIFVIGEVVRSEKDVDSKKVNLGIKFIRIADADFYHLFDYVMDKVLKE